MANEQLLKIAAPALPLATDQYERPYQDQLNNVQRLFYNRLVNTLNQITGTMGGRYIDVPSGLFFSTTTQTLAAVNTATPVDFPLEYLNNGIRVNSGTDSRVYVDYGGVYNFQFSGQLKSTSSSAKQVYIWIARNGVTIGYSTHQYTLSGNDTHLNISWNFNIDVDAGEYVELQWAADSTTVTLEAAAATSPHPGMPSAVMAVNFIAPLPNPRPTPP
jgi:hypothetical protein